MIDTIIQFIEAHKAADSVAVAWIVRETPLVYGWLRDNIVKIYPYVRDNGGVFGVTKTFFWGNKHVVATTQQTTETNKEVK